MLILKANLSSDVISPDPDHKEEYKYVLEGRDYHCALDITMNFIGGKWKTEVLWYLRNGKKRKGKVK